MDLYKNERTKFDVPLNHLEHGYIEKCEDVKELEKIIKVLRGGYEGSYPELEKLAESRLEAFNPNSRVLRKETPVTTKRDLSKDDQAALDTDLSSWLNEMRDKDDSLQKLSGLENSQHPVRGSDNNGDTSTHNGVAAGDLPPVSGTSTSIPISKQAAEEKTRKERRVKPRDYKEWDKVDVDAELAKIDGEKPKPTVKHNPGGAKDIPERVQATDLTESEKLLKANREKDKGNEAFRAGDYEEALTYYKRSISAIPTSAAYNNRAQTYLKMKNWNSAKKDCDKVLELEPRNLKALLRRAVASQGSTDLLSAKSDLMRVLREEPNNKRATEVLSEVEQALAEQKVKGRRMVIEEVEGSDESDSENTPKTLPTPKVNGHVKLVEKTPKCDIIKDISKKTKLSESANELNKTDTSERLVKSDEKDIWTEEDLKTKEPTFTANIPLSKDKVTSKSPDSMSNNSQKKKAGKKAKKSKGSTPEINGQTTKTHGESDDSKGMTEKHEEKSADNVEPHSGIQEIEISPVNNKSQEPSPSIEQEHKNVSEQPTKLIDPAKDIETTDNLSKDDKNLSTSPDAVPYNEGSKSEVSEKLSEPVVQEPVRVVQAPLPADVADIKAKGNELFKKGQYPESAELYTNAINKLSQGGSNQDLNLSVLYCNRAASRHKVGDCQGCIEDCGSALDLNPTNIKALARRAMAYETKEKYRLAYVDYRQVLLLDSSVDIAQQGSQRCSTHLIAQDGRKWRDKLPTIIPVAAPSISTLQAQSVSDTTTTPKSRNTETLPEKQPEKLPEPSKEELYETFKSEGNDFVKKGDYHSAIACYTKCIEYCPNIAAAYTNRALCYLKAKQPENVINDCTLALMVEVGNVKALFRRSLAYRELQEYDKSVSDLKQLLKLDPKNAAARKEFANILREKQEFEMKQKQPPPPKPRQKIQIVEESDSSDNEAPTTTSNKNTHKHTHKKAGESPIVSAGVSEASAESPIKTHTETFNLNTSGGENIETTKSGADASSSQGKTDHRSQKTSSKSNKGSRKSRGSQKTSKTDGDSGRKGSGKQSTVKSDGEPVVSKETKPKTVQTLSKASPYEFMQAWTALKSSQDVELTSALVKQVAPQDLKTVISNKLDGDMLSMMTKCFRVIAEQDSADKAAEYLMNLPKVPRFSVISMFMSPTDKQELSSLVQYLKNSLGDDFTSEKQNYISKEYGL